MSQTLESLRNELASVMASLIAFPSWESVLDLPAKGLRAVPEALLRKPLRVRDTFFFRGV